ncbi:hypothetical protein IW261DRAFT_1428198 [Armillaria novae-zelandiae]|uniref:Uncharacterized protein n=1 Tax=Armillaria novae-zelandiae TaxID=153914 RepID=A0AA39NAN3_9AGAR|nr:hypothetical protein IW261DRAFT_1428198 [Armillaria novae-zelandiae]
MTVYPSSVHAIVPKLRGSEDIANQLYLCPTFEAPKWKLATKAVLALIKCSPLSQTEYKGAILLTLGSPEPLSRYSYFRRFSTHDSRRLWGICAGHNGGPRPRIYELYITSNDNIARHLLRMNDAAGQAEPSVLGMLGILYWNGA